jgi:hypothetical protein
MPATQIYHRTKQVRLFNEVHWGFRVLKDSTFNANAPAGRGESSATAAP